MFITALSYPFTPFQRAGGPVILRPMLDVIFHHGESVFPTKVLIDSGADYSILRFDVARDGLGIPVDELEENKMQVKGISGESLKTVEANIEMEIRWKNRSFRYDLPVHIINNPRKQPSVTLLGRDPFFYLFRVDLRMGYTKDRTLGKFVLYPEMNKRDPGKFRRPTSIQY